MISKFISLFIENAEVSFNMIKKLLELFKIFPYVVASNVPKLLSSYEHTRYFTKLKQSNSIKSTKCQVATKF